MISLNIFLSYLFLFCVEWTRHWQRLIYYWFQTFSNLLLVRGNLCPSIHTDISRGKCFLFSVGLFQFVHGLVQSLLYIVALLLSSLFRRIYVWSITTDACVIPYIMHSWYIIKNKIATLHGQFYIYFILMQQWIKSNKQS